jgi:hypothetical protein
MEHRTCVVCSGNISSYYVNRPSSVQVAGDRYSGYTVTIKNVSDNNGGYYGGDEETHYNCDDCGLVYKHLPKVKGNYNE